MTNKELTKVQSEVKKASEKTLTGAVKAWCNLFKSGKEINEILKDNDIKVDKAIVPALVALAYDGGVYYDVFNGSDKRIVKCAVPIKRYTFNLIAKCVTYYLTHPKNER